MGAETYHSDCEGCKISQTKKQPRAGGGIIELDGNWILNHYGSDERFLGWMALQPRFHRMELTDLTPDEAKALGKNIQNIDLGLRQYWAIRFEADPVQRVYVVYFFESAFEKSSCKFHLHIHLIPRTERLRPLMYDGSRFIAWNIHQLSGQTGFPPEYQIREDTEANRKRVEGLMTYLRGYLPGPSRR